jgi:DNA-binding transcriptional ArsR family regulator
MTHRERGDEGTGVGMGVEMGEGNGPAAERAFTALAEPRRLAIIQLVARDELTAGAIADAFDVTRTAISQHLGVLKAAGLLAERRAGTRRLYRARPEALEALRRYFDEAWMAALDLARREAEGIVADGDGNGEVDDRASERDAG